MEVVNEKVVANVNNDAHLVLLTECSNEGHYCSNCHKKLGDVFKFKLSLYKYCPNCGVKFNGEMERY